MGTAPSGKDAVLFLPPAEGRAYHCGPMRALFKADGAETGSRYSVSEWWVEPDHLGVEPHTHEANEELFYVLAGTMTFIVGQEEFDAPAGSFLRVPAGVSHGFRNATDAPAGVLNIFIPGGFEEQMPAIVAWFAAQTGAGSA
jgi:mannose-6-phosphate isomerase-like protein (cupin superfamily)